MTNPTLTSQTSPFATLMEKINPKVIFHARAFYPHACDGEFDYTDKEIEVDHVEPIYDAFLFVDDANEWSNNVDQYDFNDACDESSYEDIYEFNQDLNLYKKNSNPLFQSKEDKELGTIEHVPPRRNFYFDDSGYCRVIPMFFNPCYESSLHHDDPVPDRKVPKDDTNLFDKFMDHPLKVQTLNPKSNSVNTFIITGKASVGWHVLEVGGRFFWLLINHISAQYTSVGWHFGNGSEDKNF
jgi:hypothetical protein